ncbi:MAG: hypothetical protein K6A44_02385 [bacterium]|nr:hypothetical protein [bacterium]
MMISPQAYVDELENETYEKLIKERDKLIRDVRYFEKHREEIMNNDTERICPSPDVVYQMNLEYLGALCMQISKKFNEKYEQEDEE